MKEVNSISLTIGLLVGSALGFISVSRFVRLTEDQFTIAMIAAGFYFLLRFGDVLFEITKRKAVSLFFTFSFLPGYMLIGFEYGSELVNNLAQNGMSMFLWRVDIYSFVGALLIIVIAHALESYTGFFYDIVISIAKKEQEKQLVTES